MLVTFLGHNTCAFVNSRQTKARNSENNNVEVVSVLISKVRTQNLFFGTELRGKIASWSLKRLSNNKFCFGNYVILQFLTKPTLLAVVFIFAKNWRNLVRFAWCHFRDSLLVRGATKKKVVPPFQFTTLHYITTTSWKTNLRWKLDEFKLPIKALSLLNGAFNILTQSW